MSNQPPLTNPSPKQRFLANPTDVHKHREMMVSDTFEKAQDLALIQHMAAATQNIANDVMAAAAGWQIKGALDYLLTLRMLGEVPRIVKAPDTDNLQTQ